MQIQILDRPARQIAGESRKNGRPYNFFSVNALLVRHVGGVMCGSEIELNFDKAEDCPPAGTYEVDAEQVIYANRSRRLAVGLRREHLLPIKPQARAA